MTAGILLVCAIISAAGASCPAGGAVPDEIKTAMHGLDSRTPAERVLAVEKLARLGATEAVPEVISALDDDVDTVRAAAAKACGGLGAVGAVPRLIEMLDDASTRCRADAAWSLGMLKADTAAPKLMKLLDAEDPPVRANAAFAVGEMKLDKAKDKLVELLEAPDDRTRANAIVALLRIDAVDMEDRFIELLDDPGPCTPMKAAFALGEFGSSKAIPKIKTLLGETQGHLRPLNCKIALAKLGAGELDEALGELNKAITRMEEQYDPRRVGPAIEQLSLIDTPEAKRRLKDLTKSESRPVRREAMRRMGLDWYTRATAAGEASSLPWLAATIGIAVLVLFVLRKKSTDGVKQHQIDDEQAEE